MVTMYKNNSRLIIDIKGCSPLQLSCNLIGKCRAIGYYSYTHRYKQCKEIDYQPNNIEILKKKKYVISNTNYDS